MFQSITSNQSLYVGVSLNGLVATSRDGINWTKGANQGESFNSVTSGINGTYITVGVLGTILTSTDGMTWNRSIQVTNQPLYGVVGSSANYIAV